MAYFNDLPREIKDRIFLSLDFTDIFATRQWQSIHVRRATQLNMIIIDAKNGDLKSIKYLLEKRYKLNLRTFLDEKDKYPEVTAYLSENGYKDTFMEQWVYDLLNDPWNGDAFMAAAQVGNLENMRLLIENGTPWNLTAVNQNITTTL